MKGIRKLFLGLVLLTLFGVGFKIETWAVSFDAFDNYKGGDWTDSNGNNISDDTCVFTAGMSFDPIDDFPANGKSSKKTLELWNSTDNTRVLTIAITLRTDDSGGHYIKVGDRERKSDSISDVEIATKANIRQAFGSSVGAKDFILELEGVTTPHPITVERWKVSAGAYYSNTKLNPTHITLTGPDPAYIFGGEHSTVTVKPAATNCKYRFAVWEIEGTSDITTSTDPGASQVIVGGDTTSYNITVDALYSFDATLKFNSEITKNLYLEAGGTGYSGTFTFSGYNSDNVYKVYINGNELSNAYFSFDPSAQSGDFTFSVPLTEDPGPALLAIEMDDGNVFTREFNIYDDSPVDFVDGSSTVIKVSQGFKVPLSKYVTNPNAFVEVDVSGEAANLVTVDPTSASQSQQLASSISIYASKNKSGANKKSVKLDGVTSVAGVSVYPKPTLSKDGGGSDSSSTATSSLKLTLKMPTGVYYNNVENDDLTDARLVFTRSSDGGKNHIESVSWTSSDSSISKEVSKSLSADQLITILKDLCKDDEEEIHVKGYAYYDGDIDKNIVSNDETIKVYKIKLDGSGGAKYKVNNTDMDDDYFYAVKGLRYTVKSSPKNTGDKFLNWDNDRSSTETYTFTADGSKTLKANYGSSSSSSPSSSSSSSSNKTAVNGDTNGDDYDDVPKTGESKADIWILWSVLLISILGAGFMIRKRFGLVRAIAAADEEMAKAVHDEKVEAEKKEKESKMQMLKDLRKL